MTETLVQKFNRWSAGLIAAGVGVTLLLVGNLTLSDARKTVQLAVIEEGLRDKVSIELWSADKRELHTRIGNNADDIAELKGEDKNIYKRLGEVRELARSGPN